MRRATGLLAIVVPTIVAACAISPHPAAELDSPALELEVPRPALVMRLQPPDEDGKRSLTELAPSKGDVAGFGGTVIGQLAAGMPGGAVLGFGSQVAGGNRIGKAVGSTLGALVGSMLGPLGSMIGGLVGGYAGDLNNEGSAEPTLQAAAPGAGYIDSLDFGPPREKTS